MGRKLAGFLVVVCAAVFPVLGFAQSEGLLSDLGIEVSGDVSYYSEYIWRGMLLDGDPVLQSGLYMAGPKTKFGRLTAKLWVSNDFSNSDSRTTSEEFDYILDYTYDFPEVSLSLGHTYYDYPQADTYSREFYTGIALPKVFLSPLISVYRDYGKPEDGGGEGTYTVLNAAYSMPLKISKYDCTLDLSGHYGYNYELFINGKGADVGLTAGLTVPLTKNSTLSSTINYSIPLKDLKKSSDGNQKSRVYTGVTLKYKF